MKNMTRQQRRGLQRQVKQKEGNIDITIEDISLPQPIIFPAGYRMTTHDKFKVMVKEELRITKKAWWKWVSKLTFGYWKPKYKVKVIYL